MTSTKSKPRFTDLLKGAMEKYELNQAELSRYLGVNESTISMWLSGNRTPLGIVASAVTEKLEQLRNDPEGLAKAKERKQTGPKPPKVTDAERKMFAAALADTLETSGLKQYELALLLGTSSGTISQQLRGLRVPEAKDRKAVYAKLKDAKTVAREIMAAKAEAKAKRKAKKRPSKKRKRRKKSAAKKKVAAAEV